MPFQIIQHDLIQMRTDIIVNATDQYYSGGGGVDHAIHQAAGPELSEACGFLGRLHLGEVKATEGYNLPVKYIFHTSGPRWKGGSREELVLLGNCYRNSINLAREKKCTSIAFPLISSKGKHFPKEIALTVAIDAIRSALEDHDDIDIYLVVFGNSIKTLSETLFPEIQQIIEEDYRPSTLQREMVGRLNIMIQFKDLESSTSLLDQVEIEHLVLLLKSLMKICRKEYFHRIGPSCLSLLSIASSLLFLLFSRKILNYRLHRSLSYLRRIYFHENRKTSYSLSIG
jgi:O-acetyl-ADP-ribose deacetylase (regulator of RNase III)